MRLLAALIILGALGCAKSRPGANPPAQQIGAVHGFFGPRTSPAPPAPIRSLTIYAVGSTSRTIKLGTYESLSVEVFDDQGQRFPNAQVWFKDVPPGIVLGLGTTPSDYYGQASVAASPYGQGPFDVQAQAYTTHAVSNVVTFTVTGR